MYPAGPQAGINHLLIDEARTGQTVVRLTNGDPFLLERGGRKAEALVEAGITFEVVPGGARAASAVAPVPPSGRSGADRNAHTASRAQPGPYRSCRFGHEPDLALSLRGRRHRVPPPAAVSPLLVDSDVVNEEALRE